MLTAKGKRRQLKDLILGWVSAIWWSHRAAGVAAWVKSPRDLPGVAALQAPGSAQPSPSRAAQRLRDCCMPTGRSQQQQRGSGQRGGGQCGRGRGGSRAAAGARRLGCRRGTGGRAGHASHAGHAGRGVGAASGCRQGAASQAWHAGRPHEHGGVACSRGSGSSSGCSGAPCTAVARHPRTQLRAAGGWPAAGAAAQPPTRADLRDGRLHR